MILFCTVACFLVAVSVPFEWGFEPALALLSIFFLALLMELMTDFPVVATMAEVVVVIWALVAVLVGAAAAWGACDRWLYRHYDLRERLRYNVSQTIFLAQIFSVLFAVAPFAVVIGLVKVSRSARGFK